MFDGVLDGFSRTNEFERNLITSFILTRIYYVERGYEFWTKISYVLITFDRVLY